MRVCLTSVHGGKEFVFHGSALCIFFGPTPASRGCEPRAASPVRLVGRIDLGADTVAQLKAVPAGARVTVRSAPVDT